MGFLVITAVVTFVTYLLAAVSLFGIPPSISDTYYLYEAKHKNLGYVFTVFMFSVAFLMIAPMVDYAMFDWWQFLGFLCPMGIAFCGCAAWSKDKEVKPIHFAGAYTGAIAGLLWCFLASTTPTLITLIAMSIICWLLADVTNTNKCYIWWLEIVAFGTISLILLHLYIS